MSRCFAMFAALAVAAVGCAKRVPEHAVNQIVPRGSNPVSVSTTGIVGPAGNYYADVTLTATPTSGSGPSTPIKARIQVSVK